MTINLDLPAASAMGLDEFVALADAAALDSPESLVAIAPNFSALANDRDLLAIRLNESLKRYVDGASMLTYTPQSIVLAHGRNFYVRANIWTPLQLEGGFRSQEERVFSYRSTHDHNFDFMTVGYHGPGYETDLYQYDPSTVEGHIGEQVDLEPLGRERLTPGRVMVYRAKRDVHTQLPPPSLSISLNVMLIDPRWSQRDQYFFDPATGRITGLPAIAAVHRRASVVAMLGYLANGESIDLLHALLRSADCQRIREAAARALAVAPGLGTGDRAAALGDALGDRSPVVRRAASELLAAIG